MDYTLFWETDQIALKSTGKSIGLHCLNKKADSRAISLARSNIGDNYYHSVVVIGNLK